MITRKAAGAVAIIVLVAIGGLAAYEFYFMRGQSQCVSVQPGKPVTTHLGSRTFGPVTEYPLPGNDTWPSAITAAPDGSVWFAQEAVPGVAHFYPSNDTLVEYGWPGYKPPTLANCFPSKGTVSAGMALWNGRVWSVDEFANMIFGVNPGDGSVVSINSTGKANYPYWLAVGPHGDLWVTFDDTPARLARVFPNLTMSVTDLAGTGKDSPLQLDFVNSSLALLATINLSQNTTTKGCVCDGHIYSFDPSKVGATVAPSVVGGSYKLIEPTSVSFSEGRVWVAQHYASSVVSYDFATRAWTEYPTSLVPWTNTTLPLLIAANGSSVWLNEHYANKIALVEPTAGTMTEISESSPPTSSSSGIQNDEYIAISGSRVWFTSMTGNYIGYVDGSYEPAFGIGPAGTNAATIPRGGNASVGLEVTGAWSGPLKVNVSDSEGYSSIPTAIRVTPSSTMVPPGTRYLFSVEVTASQTAPRGEYTVAVTVTDEGIQRSAFLYVTVT